ncbi:Ig domain-containing protein [Staphylococcus xylosus]|uniref:Ig-like domain-containing protein n=1 Tax=Staphylococcus xylosus TaxID=1288 RepID=UPI000E69AF3D|nr:Ig-like domain-containing protein [Staphylococcus xylosus]RIM87761.1 Ig domain-containing protein [Staphylococcus xylosus]
MTDILKVYKGDEVVGTGERNEDDKGNVTINNLKANTTYPKGTFKASWSNEHGESEKEDIEEFKTNPIKVTGVNLEKESLDLNIDDTETLDFNVTPSTATDKSVTFNSSNEVVASVNNEGLVTALSAGTSEITVTTTDGSKTAKVTVNVNE